MLENNVLCTRSVTYNYNKRFPYPLKIRISERKSGKMAAMILNEFSKEKVLTNIIVLSF